MKKISTKQLYKLIEGKVREALINGEDYDEDAERREQMASDWADLERMNKKFASSKNPVLANKYNHNVEDGRENAEIYAHGLYGLDEQKIMRAIRNRINETLMNIANS